jgi:hypothetical protein
VYYEVGQVYELEYYNDVASYIHGTSTLYLPAYTGSDAISYTIIPSTQNCIPSTATFTLITGTNYSGAHLEVIHGSGVPAYTGLSFTHVGDEYIMGPIEFSHIFTFKLTAGPKLTIIITGFNSSPL